LIDYAANPTQGETAHLMLNAARLLLAARISKRKKLQNLGFARLFGDDHTPSFSPAVHDAGF
jgi:hypothetical protein